LQPYEDNLSSCGLYPHSKNILSLNTGNPSNDAPHLYKYNT
jgi:hypothetical protein